MHFSKKSMGPVLATGLFIVVAIVATISFQVWFQNYSSQVFSDVESSGTSLDISLEEFDGRELYIRGSEGTNIESIYLGGEECDYQGELDEGLNRLDIRECMEEDIYQVVEVSVDTGEKMYLLKTYIGEEPIATYPQITNFNYQIDDKPDEISYEFNIDDDNSKKECIFSDNIEKSTCEFEENQIFREYEYEEFYSERNISIKAENEFELIDSKNYSIWKGKYIDENWRLEGEDYYLREKETNLEKEELYSIDFRDGSIPISHREEYFNDELTISLWLNLDSFNRVNGNMQRHLDAREGDPFNRGYVFQSHDEHDIDFHVTSIGKRVNVESEELDDVEEGEWFHVAFTYSLDNEKMKLYVNGEKVDEKSVQEEIPETNNHLMISERVDFNGEETEGKLDEIRFYDTSLSKENIEKLSSYRAVELETSNLVSRWRFNEGEGDEVLEIVEGDTAQIEGDTSWQELYKNGYFITRYEMPDFENLKEVYFKAEKSNLDKYFLFKDEYDYPARFDDDWEEFENLNLTNNIENNNLFLKFEFDNTNSYLENFLFILFNKIN